MPALMKQGSLLLQLGRKDEAGKVYQAAVRVDPREALAYNNLAWMAAESGKNLDQAEQWARKAVELGPDVAEFQDTLGWTYRARGKLKEAERALQRATGLQGASASAFYHLGVVEQALGKTPEATAAFRKALELDKNHEAAAQALRKLGVS
jgi:tetratricopeptide (TPR) repeat protein